MIKEVLDFKQIKSFYESHYSDVSSYLLPSKENNYEYLAFCSDQGEILAMVALELKYGKVAFLWQMVVHTDYRNQGIASQFIDKLEPYLKVKGYIKLLAYVYTTNFPIIIFIFKKRFFS